MITLPAPEDLVEWHLENQLREAGFTDVSVVREGRDQIIVTAKNSSGNALTAKDRGTVQRLVTEHRRPEQVGAKSMAAQQEAVEFLRTRTGTLEQRVDALTTMLVGPPAPTE